MKAAIIYTSVTGNTTYIAETIQANMEKRNVVTDLIPVHEFNPEQLHDYDIVAIGTYTWANGEIPIEMEEVYEAFETGDLQHLVTGVFGSGDSFFAHYCGAVDLFRDMLYVHTNLAVTLKIELMPQEPDLVKCEKFCDRLLQETMVVQ